MLQLMMTLSVVVLIVASQPCVRPSIIRITSKKKGKDYGNFYDIGCCHSDLCSHRFFRSIYRNETLSTSIRI